MNIFEIIFIILCVLFVFFVIIKSVIDRKNGKGCSCDCSSCSACCNLKYKENIMKYLKCESCGAIIKEIVPCNCKDCGITCCGKKMVEIDDPNIKGTGKIVTCKSCGAKVEIIVPCDCPNCGIICCGITME